MGLTLQCGAMVTAVKGQGVAAVRAAWIACLGDSDHTSWRSAWPRAKNLRCFHFYIDFVFWNFRFPAKLSRKSRVPSCSLHWNIITTQSPGWTLGFPLGLVHSVWQVFITASDSWVTKSCLTLPTPWTVACQASLSMRFSRQGYWSGLPFPSPGVIFIC